jgi:hypothetical protein
VSAIVSVKPESTTSWKSLFVSWCNGTHNGTADVVPQPHVGELHTTHAKKRAVFTVSGIVVRGRWMTALVKANGSGRWHCADVPYRATGKRYARSFFYN